MTVVKNRTYLLERMAAHTTRVLCRIAVTTVIASIPVAPTPRHVDSQLLRLLTIKKLYTVFEWSTGLFSGCFCGFTRVLSVVHVWKTVYNFCTVVVEGAAY